MRIRAFPLVPLVLVATQTASAQDYGDPSGRAWSVSADIRVVAVDGEPSWLDGGWGKARFGPDVPRTRLDAQAHAAEAAVAWSPQVSWSLGATVVALAQDGQDKPVDLSEAYLTYRHDPLGSVRLHARAGLFWPPVSHEHSGPAWGVTDTITPSAINSWIGEEVKVGALEGTVSLPAGAGRISLTAAAFGFNDTSGTLLAFRGWALHDQKVTAFSLQPLPPLDAFMQYAQAPRTRPIIELDHRPGWYARVAWTSKTARVDAFYYDNRGDPEAVNSTLQWGWRTRFGALGATVEHGPVMLTAQAMAGTTVMGFPMAGRIWVDTSFRSAFALATARLGPGTISARAETFRTRGRGSVLGENEGEDGWATTLAARRPIGDHLALLAEWLHLGSTRDARTRGGLPPEQDQDVVQLALRVRS